MCRMLALTDYDFKIHENLLEGFLELATKGKVPPGNRPGHHDGWGIGYHRRGVTGLIRSANSASDEKNKFLKALERIKSADILIVHLRKSAWKNTKNVYNSHPFLYKNRLFAHNGTVLDYDKLGPGKKRRKAILDSEALFLHVNAGCRKLTGRKLQMIFNDAEKRVKHTSLTCLLSEGKRLFAYRECSKNPSYYTLYRARTSGSVILSSEPVSKKLKWKHLRKKAVYSF
ncbi:MAG: class II glutamine amidotransferase [Endomicrobiales bacterium]|nr:class II glutamine amidotransferase [Endomicrobiales bacterium]